MSSVIKQYQSLDLVRNSLLNAKINPMTTPERVALTLSAEDDGYTVWDTTLDVFLVWNGSSWVNPAGEGLSIDNNIDGYILTATGTATLSGRSSLRAITNGLEVVASGSNGANLVLDSTATGGEKWGVYSFSSVNTIPGAIGYHNITADKTPFIFTTADWRFINPYILKWTVDDYGYADVGTVDVGIGWDAPGRLQINNGMDGSYADLQLRNLFINTIDNDNTLTQVLARDSVTGQVKYVMSSTIISGVTAGGELSGTYPNPTLVNSAVTGKLLSGLNLTGGGSISATDTILEAFGKVQNQISAMVGGVTYQNVWDASINTPALTSGVGNKGDYYIVSVAGSTNLDGITDWKVGDWAIFNGTTWDKVDNTDAVSSVNGYTGAVSLVTSDIAEAGNLYYTDARARAAISSTAIGLNYSSITGEITLTPGYVIPTTIQETNWNEAYTNRITSLTTTGTSGVATLIGNVLNIPQYQPLLTNPVTGTGVAGQIAYWSGTNGITGSTKFRWIDASNTLAMGTASNVGSIIVNSSIEIRTSGRVYIYGNDGAHIKGLLRLENTPAATTIANFLTQSVGIVYQRTPSQVLTDIGATPLTRTLTINGVAYDLSADRSWTVTSMVYPSAGIAVSTGTAWGASITDNSANWNTAYSWGNHATAGYQPAATAITTSNIGSQSVAYATSAGTASNAIVNAGNASPAWYPVVWHSGNTLYSSAVEIYAAGAYLRAQYVTTTDSLETGITRFVIKNGDDYHRSATVGTAAAAIQSVASGTWGISVSGWAGAASQVTHYASRIDSAWYNVVWASGNPSYMYSADSVQIRSSDGSLRANIYYDHSNTGYYVAPAGTSNIWSLQTNGGAAMGGGWNRSLLLSASFPVIVFNSSGTKFSGIGVDYSVADSGFRFWVNGSSSDISSTGTVAMSINTGNYVTASGSFRAPVFYDSTDTAYYGAFSGTSRMNTIVYNSLKWAGDQTYGFIDRNVYADTINGRGSDALELNYYDGGPVKIGSGTYGSKDLYAGALYDAGSRVAISRSEGRNYVDYSRYVYNNGAYSGSGWVEPSNLGVRYADNAGYLPPVYGGGVQSNPQAYFNEGIGVKVAMTGVPFAWCDTLWINGYTGSDVPYMVAIHTARNGQPRMWLSTQSNRSTSYGSTYEVISSWNIASQSVAYASDSGALNGWGYTSYAYRSGGTGYYQVGDWIQINSNTGLYWPGYYGAHIAPNVVSSYTQLRIVGSKNSYGGIYDEYSAVNIGMYDGSGNGGVYREANSLWFWYYHIGNNGMGIGTSTTSTSYKLYVNGNIYATGDVTAYSDRRKKTNIVTINNALETVTKMRGVFYDKIGEEEKGRQLGVIAQEVNEVLPEAVTYAKDVDEYGVKYGNMVGLLLEAIKEQQGQIESQKTEISELKDLVKQLLK